MEGCDMNKPVELLARIQTGYAFQMLCYKRLSEAKLKFDQDAIRKEISESCEYLQKLDSQLTQLIEIEREKHKIIFIHKKVA